MKHRWAAMPVLAVLTCSGFIATTTSSASASTPARHYQNCTQLHKAYPHGVGKVGARDHVTGRSKPVTNFKRSNALYAANKNSDRDRDGIACEKH